MKISWILLPALLFAGTQAGLAQVSDRCSPGWAMLNQLREQLSADTPPATLQLLRSSVETRLRACREIPDLWYYRYRISEKLKNIIDANYSRTQASEGGSPLLATGFDPFAAVTESKKIAEAPLSKTIREKWALVIGVDEFADPSIRKLNFTGDDARGFASLLSDPEVGDFKKENVFCLVNKQATLLGIRQAIGHIREVAKPDDLVLVYMASHGSPRESDPNGVSYVITYDTRIDSAANLYATSLQMIDLSQLLRRDIQARRVVLILDTCYSGDATGSRGVQVHAPEKIVGPPAAFSAALDGFSTNAARVVMSASRAEQVSWESPTLHHGYFTYFLMQALQQSHGKMPLEKVFDYVRDHTGEAVQRDHPGVSQTPTVQENAEGAAIVLGADASGKL